MEVMGQNIEVLGAEGEEICAHVKYRLVQVRCCGMKWESFFNYLFVVDGW